MRGTRECGRCEWWGDQSEPSPGQRICHEGPRPAPKYSTDWCGRFHLAEHLAGGVDLRKPKGDPNA